MLWSHLQGYGLTKDRDHGNGSPQRAPPGLTDFFFFNVNQDSQGSEKSHNNLFTF